LRFLESTEHDWRVPESNGFTRERLAREFQLSFGREPRTFSAPGRVNLIGEHTDYNDGFVLPMAIDRRTYVAGAPRPDRRLRVRSLNGGNELDLDLDRPGPKRQGHFGDYVQGIAQALRARGFSLSGADLLILGEVPTGAGLSSSAALEISVGYALLCLSGIAEPELVPLALAGQAAEHEYVGILCGIMDQYVSALAQAGSALLIDCRSLESRPVPLRLGGACVMICDTRVKHELASSAYNERCAECREGIELLARSLPGVRSLRDVSAEDLARVTLPAIVQRRCRHVVSETERTLRAAAALEAGELERVGALMSESHASLRDDYEVSCAELDAAVAVASAEPGVYGARMTGGGFGGCSVILLEKSAVERVSRALERHFAEHFATTPNLFTSAPCGGVREEPAS
jgi:galactokinase